MILPKNELVMKDTYPAPEKSADETPHLTARMSTVGNPFFWIFFAACPALYIYNKPNAPVDVANLSARMQNNMFIFIAAFIGLSINLVAGAIKPPRINRIVVLSGYFFEVFSFAFLAYKVFLA